MKTLHIMDFKNIFEDDKIASKTTHEQKCIEDSIQKQMKTTELQRHLHMNYLMDGLDSVSRRCETLDSSRTWIAYWCVHGLNILGAEIPPEKKTKIVEFLKTCEHHQGGYGGGPGQIPHLATTYASVMCLVSLKSEEALNSIDLVKLSSFLKRMKQPDGSFTVHEGGEVDIRGAYTALAVASMCGLMTSELTEYTAEWILRCQTYEGGFGGEPSVEAHGGYTFCGVAVMSLLQKFHMIDTQKLSNWLMNRQMRFEGGFNGRTNKLVDGCYSFWQAGAVAILDEELAQMGIHDIRGGALFNEKMLQEFILVCCQDNRGGLRDKPEKRSDYYHSCYVLSGLSLAQGMNSDIVGGPGNKVNNICSLFNVASDVPKTAHSFFEKKLFTLSKK